jgi:hypothetical protein
VIPVGTARNRKNLYHKGHEETPRKPLVIAAFTWDPTDTAFLLKRGPRRKLKLASKRRAQERDRGVDRICFDVCRHIGSSFLFRLRKIYET